VVTANFPWLVWFEFAVCVGLIAYAGPKLSRYGDVIAEKTGLGGAWIGLILLATVTSLPELATGISAIVIADVPNIAIGDALGSCVFNLAIISLADVLHREQSVYAKASQGNIVSAAFGIVMLVPVAGSLLPAVQAQGWSIGHVGIYVPIVLALYIVAIRTIYQYERTRLAEFVESLTDRYPEITLRQAALRYAGAAAAVIIAGGWLPFLGNDIAMLMHWHDSFVGTLLIALATSVPEMVVTLAALRLGAVDMAIANLFGSNLFDILIIAVDDVMFMKGPILSFVSPAHAVSALSAIMMTALAVIGLMYRSNRRLFRKVEWVSLALLAIYITNSYVLFRYGA
jgi:cation:H+ antiporter